MSEYDGMPLERGLVVSLDGGYRTAAYHCKCGRRQKAKCDGFPGGIPESTAEFVGWRRIDGKWECPMCSGNEANLQKVFGQ